MSHGNRQNQVSVWKSHGRELEAQNDLNDVHIFLLPCGAESGGPLQSGRLGSGFEFSLCRLSLEGSQMNALSPSPFPFLEA